jgi:hypothetical protein
VLWWWADILNATPGHVLIHIYTKYDGCGPQDKKSFALEKIKLLIW